MWILLIVQVAAGVFPDRTSWRDTSARTLASNRTAAPCARSVFLAPIIWANISKYIAGNEEDLEALGEPVCPLSCRHPQVCVGVDRLVQLVPLLLLQLPPPLQLPHPTVAAAAAVVFKVHRSLLIAIRVTWAVCSITTKVELRALISYSSSSSPYYY